MAKYKKAKRFALLCVLCVLVMAFAVPSASAADLSKVYGKTLDRIRVRDSASTNGAVIDNIVKGACVYVTGSKTSGSLTFVQIKYRASDGSVATGWMCQSDGSTTYVSILSAEDAKKSFGVADGNVPSKVVGTFSSAQRKASVSEADSSYIKLGSTGEAVRDLQTKLKALGIYSAEITGEVGSKTQAAIKAFQRRYGLTADGVVGPKTLAQIDAVYASSGKSDASGTVTGTSGGNIKLGSTGTDVAQLQRDLKQLGLYAAEITGKVGAKTETAIKDFQRKYGLTADGVAGSKTLAAIAAAIAGGSSSSSSSSSGTTGGALRLNSTGAAVQALQENLTTLGLYYAEITGHYGAKTETAVRKFQSGHGLTVDGIAGSKTLEAIARAVTASGGQLSSGGTVTGALREGSTGTAVTELQQMLTKLGYYYGSITGNFGSLTKQAVRKFQDEHGLTVDGIAGTETLRRLRMLSGVADSTGSSGSTGGTSSGSTASSGYARIKGSSVNLREKPSVSSKTKIALDNGTVCRITERTTTAAGVWYKVSATVGKYTYVGYVFGDYLTMMSSAEAEDWQNDAAHETYEGVVTVKGSGVNLREGPGMTYPSAGKANWGEEFYVVGSEGDWYQLSNGLWISKECCSYSAGTTLSGFAGPYDYNKSGYPDEGSAVTDVQVALKALGRYDGPISGHYGLNTAEAVRNFKKDNGMSNTTQLDKSAYDAIMAAYVAANEGSGANVDWKGVTEFYSLDWFANKDFYKKIGLDRDKGRDKSIVLTDLDSGKEMYIYVQYINNHLDVEPLTEADTATLCQMFNVTAPSRIPSGKRLSAALTVTTTVNGQKYTLTFPCAVYGVPHGEDKIGGNGYEGQFCIHFKGTRTNESNTANHLNTEAVERARTLLLGQLKEKTERPAGL